jgi:hypothetical protein
MKGRLVMSLQTSDVFQALRNAYKAGLLEQKPEAEFVFSPGTRFFESMKGPLLNSGVAVWAEKLEMFAPLIKFLADKKNWKPVELQTADVFQALRNAYKAGLLEQGMDEYTCTPGCRYFETMKETILKTDIGELAKELSMAAPAIKFLADEKNWNMKQEER